MQAIVELDNISISAKPPKTLSSKVLVREATLAISAGSIHGVVGESGSGKSLCARAIIDLLPPNVYISAGNIRHQIAKSAIRYIPQDALNSLDPFFKIQYLFKIAAKKYKFSFQDIHNTLTALSLSTSVKESRLLLRKLPNQLSGGMKQRILIALALLTDSALIIADEPTTALDKENRELFFKLLKQIKETRKNLSIMVISHDIHSVAEHCDYVSVMYAGMVVESGTKNEIVENPRHPYTQMLFSCLPKITLEEGRVKRVPLEKIIGNIADDDVELSGCRFQKRCSIINQEIEKNCLQISDYQGASPTHKFFCVVKPPMGDQGASP